MQLSEGLDSVHSYFSGSNFPVREPTFSNFFHEFIFSIQSVMQSLKGRQYRKFIKRCAPVVAQINELEKGLQSLSDESIGAATKASNIYATLPRMGRALDDLLPEAFAGGNKNGARRDFAVRTIQVCDPADRMANGSLRCPVDRRHGPCVSGISRRWQLEKVKLLVSTCPLYLNALSGQNCQLVTVNDYLAPTGLPLDGCPVRIFGPYALDVYKTACLPRSGGKCMRGI